MSIATDEARKAEASVLERELNGTSWLLGFERGYIAGRTAKPTEAEIEAAASVIALKVGNRILSKKLMKDALEAARQVVSK